MSFLGMVESFHVLAFYYKKIGGNVCEFIILFTILLKRKQRYLYCLCADVVFSLLYLYLVASQNANTVFLIS